MNLSDPTRSLLFYVFSEVESGFHMATVTGSIVSLWWIVLSLTGLLDSLYILYTLLFSIHTFPVAVLGGWYKTSLFHRSAVFLDLVYCLVDNSWLLGYIFYIMAGSVNKVILVGRLGRDPEVRITAGGLQVCNLTIATSTFSQSDSGLKEEVTEWHRVVAFGRLAEICSQFLSKGRLVYVEGRLQTRKWEDRNGFVRYTTEIIMTNMQILDSKKDELSSQDVAKVSLPPDEPKANEPLDQPSHEEEEEEEDDIPF